MVFEKEKEVPYLLIGRIKWLSLQKHFNKTKNKAQNKEEICKLLRRDKNV